MSKSIYFITHIYNLLPQLLGHLSLNFQLHFIKIKQKSSYVIPGGK
jgi:hypothetical protein